MTMENVVRGRILKPQRVLLYGEPKIGKTTFAAESESPIFLGAEDGTNEFDIARLPQPRSWEEAFEGIDFLTHSDHNWKTLVVDTVDWLEPLCWKHLCATRKTKDGATATDIEAYGYGDGFRIALDLWRTYLARLERLRDRRGMWIIQLAHSHVKTFKNPVGPDYDRYTLRMHEKAAALMREWSDIVLYVREEVYTHEQKKRVKGVGKGPRVMHTMGSAAWDAGSRLSLPETIPLDWREFYYHVQQQQPANSAKLLAQIEELLAQVESERIQGLVKADVTAAGDDAAVLARIYNKLTATVGLQDNADDNSNQDNG